MRRTCRPIYRILYSEWNGLHNIQTYMGEVVGIEGSRLHTHDL